MAQLLIVEDEPVIAFDLKLCVEQAGHTVVGVAESAAEALKMWKNHSPDLFLIDINIKGPEDGVGLARSISEQSTIPFIFITSYHDKSTLERVQGLHPAAYLLKPFREEEVVANIHLALRKHRVDKKENHVPGKLFVRNGGQLRPVKADDILFARGESNYTVLHMTGNRKVTISHTLKSIEDKLPSPPFCRVHKGYIIHLEFIDAIEHSVVIVNGETIPIGKTFRTALFEKMQIL